MFRRLFITRSSVLRDLTLACASRDADRVELALVDAYRVGVTAKFVPTLIELLQTPWHTRHEDVVQLLQQLKDPRAVVPLELAAQSSHDYLSFDEHFGLARKCTWALADIGTEEAKGALSRLAGSDNQLIREYASRRLDRWALEADRKGI